MLETLWEADYDDTYSWWVFRTGQQDGTSQMSGQVPYDKDHQNAFSVYSRYTDATQNVDWYMVSNYTNSLNRWGGFAPQGWTVPYASQYQKMIDNIAGIATNKPDGTIGASFLKGGVYGLNTKATGLVGVTFSTQYHGSFTSVSLCNKDVLYQPKVKSRIIARLFGKFSYICSRNV